MDMIQKIDEIYEDSEYAELETLVSLTEEYFKETKMESYGYFLEDAVNLQRGESVSLNEAAKKANDKDENLLKKAGKWIGTKLKNLWDMILKLFDKIRKFFAGKKNDVEKAEALGNEVHELYSKMTPEQLEEIHKRASKGKSKDSDVTKESFELDNSEDCYYMEESEPIRRVMTEDSYHQLVIKTVTNKGKWLNNFVPMIVHFNDDAFKKHFQKLGDLVQQSTQMLKSSSSQRVISVDSLKKSMQDYKSKISWEVRNVNRITNSIFDIKKIIRCKNYGKYYHNVKLLIRDLDVKVMNFKSQAELSRKEFEKIINEINAYDKNPKYGDGFVNPKLKEKVDQISDLTNWLLNTVKELAKLSGDINKILADEIKELDELKIYASSTIIGSNGRVVNQSTQQSTHPGGQPTPAPTQGKVDLTRPGGKKQSSSPKIVEPEEKREIYWDEDPEYKNSNDGDPSSTWVFKYTDGVWRTGKGGWPALFTSANEKKYLAFTLKPAKQINGTDTNDKFEAHRNPSKDLPADAVVK